MLLKEVTAPTSTDLIKQVNRYLRECHGCVINVSTPTGVLRQLQSTLAEDIRQQRINGATPEDADYARALLVQRTVQQLIAQRSITESYRSSSNPVFVRLCASLCDSACECVNLGDTVDHAVHKVMDVYRSSRYRFPDSEVEQQVREQINHALGIDPVPVNHTLMDQTVPQDDHWEAEPDTDAPTASELAQALRSQLDAELTGTVPAAELSQHIDSVAQMYAGIPGTKINSALLSDMTNQLRRRIANSDTESEAAQHASVKVKLLLADMLKDEDHIEQDSSLIIEQELGNAMLRRLKLVHPEVFDEHTPEQIAAAVADTARFEARLGTTAADLSAVDSWLSYVISDLREHSAVSEAAPIVAGAAKAFASGAGAAVANRVMDHISETALGEHPVIQPLLKVYGPNPVHAALSDLGDRQHKMTVDELAQEIRRRILRGDYDAELPSAGRTQEPHSDVEESTAAVDDGKDHFDFRGRTYPVTGDADLSEKRYAKKRKKSSGMKENRRSARPLVELDQAASDLQDAFSSSTVSEFVSRFSEIASDSKVQALLRAGHGDGDPDDEKVMYREGVISVGQLRPTQSEIGFDQSIANILTDRYNSLTSILDGAADVGGPIVTYNGQFVIDGHHRWSQVYAANPNAKIPALDIQGDFPPQKVLKIVHAAVAVIAGGVPSSDPKGINILDGVRPQQVLDAVNQLLTDSAKQIWASKGFNDNRSIAKHIYQNLQRLIKNNQPISGAPPRADMPQTDKPDGTTSKQKLDLLKTGKVNFLDPSPEDVLAPESDISEKRYAKKRRKS